MIPRHLIVRIAALGMMTAVVAWPVASSHGQTIELGPNRLQINPPETIPDEPERPYRPLEPESITEYEAIQIAKGEGLDRVERVREGRRGWVVVGIDRNGDDMRIMISRDGEVIDVQRD
ncbi:PepSY domain-containing protein [Bosea sp. (in: a-proteobacteria)]|uniref:PepSY domain-containing protein n=1 Tax=Bosea sp. (in: a-proteobacteria) TaxID=1871050 RepID=UPI002736EDB5|nr:PepSY domain-containing protein [Bosea sp. (in: a-proteobacteria)]MDP3406665.1 PepSY domain-containing protein [Bosea sp. (in: a-proteobacteria)]